MRPTADIQQARANYDALTADFELPTGVEAHERSIAGVPGLWLKPAGDASSGTIVHCHGGGFVSGSLRSHRVLAASLASATRFEVFLVDYGLAPEARFPRQRDQVRDVFVALAESGETPVLGGDSAGGGLIFQIACQLRDSDLPMPTAMFAIGPMVDFEMRGASYSKIGSDPWSTSRAAHEFVVDAYLGPTPRDDPAANVLHADLAGLPPTLIQVAADEFLRDDANSLAEGIRHASGDVVLEIVPEVVHDWPLFSPIFAPARAAIDTISRFLHQHARPSLS